MSSVVDMDDLHPLSKNILERAAGAICGMVESSTDSVLNALRQVKGRLIAMTECHYSEGCSELVRRYLGERGYTVIPCHADGVGDRAMEELIKQGIFDAVVDIAPGGLSEELFGGNRAAGPDRFEAAGRRGLPMVVAPCGFDMISYGPIKRKDTSDPLWLSRKITERKYYVHDSYPVQARTNAKEMKQLARVVADKLNRSKGPVKFLVPLGGWSSLSARGKDLYDPDTDRALIEELHKLLRPEIKIEELELTLNSPEFAAVVVDSIDEMMKAART